MGLYDSIYLKMKCPYCKEVSEMEFQTKDGDYRMMAYRVGDKFQEGRFSKIDAIGDCQSSTCQLESAKECVWTSGYYGGFSRSFDVYIYCDKKGRITNKIKIYSLNNHKGTMYGKLGELKGKQDNMKIVRYVDFKKGKMIPAKYKKMKTNGWLDKFKQDSFDNGKATYLNILYLYNLEDSEEAFRIWFCWRYKLDRILRGLQTKLHLSGDEEFASIFLSNHQEDIIKFCEGVK